MNDARRLSFDDVVEAYDRLRPGYPAAMYDAVFALAPPGRVVEVGCGTGKATRALLARGCTVLAAEPGPRLAAFARRTLDAARFRVVETDFEALEVEGTVDFVWAAQSWHWVGPDGFRRAHELLEPRGRLVLVWNRPVRSSVNLQPAYDAAYGDDAGSPPGPIDAEVAEHAAEITDSGWFDAPRIVRAPWTSAHSAAGYTALMDTWSPVRALGEAKPAFLAHVRRLIDDAAGTIRRDLECVAFVARPL